MTNLFIDDGLILGNTNLTKPPLLNADQTIQVGQILTEFTNNGGQVYVACPKNMMANMQRTAFMAQFAGNSNFTLVGYESNGKSTDILPEKPINGGAVFLTGNLIANGVVGKSLGRHVATHHVVTGFNKENLVSELEIIARQLSKPTYF